MNLISGQDLILTQNQIQPDQTPPKSDNKGKTFARIQKSSVEKTPRCESSASGERPTSEMKSSMISVGQ